MQKMKLSLVIPAYNEAAIIRDTIEQTLSYLSGEFSDFELIISDDGSTDNTKKIAGEIKDPRLWVTGHFPNKGKGAAVRQGVLSAKGDIIMYTDADLAYGLEAVGALSRLLVSEGADAAIGSRKKHPEGYADYPPIRFVASRCFSLITGLMAGFQYDTQCGLKAFTREGAREIFSRCTVDGFAFDFEAMMICSKLGLHVEQLPVKIINHRESKVSVFSDSIRMFSDVVKIRNGVNMRMKKERR